MRLFYPTRHALHRPQKDYSDGLPPFEHLEVPERVDLVLGGLQAAGPFEIMNVDEEAVEDARALHDGDYIEFLLAMARHIPAGQEYVPPVFRNDLALAPLAFRGGMYCKEVGTPIGPGTGTAALNAAATAAAAAEHLAERGEDVFALCRPPGHHAGRRRYGGYAYFNNAYIAVRRLAKRGWRTPVLDVDYHLGDGSLEFAAESAPYFSLHADPWRNYPYWDAALQLERPHVRLESLPAGADATTYLSRLSRLLENISALHPDAIVVSIGFDTVRSDYIQDEEIRLEADDFTRVGRAIGSLTAPLLLVLEGGYDRQSLAACARNFMSGLVAARPLRR
jgi:acetoin utilization deacetylase AcuC-like enzyme